jgi:2-enoate reductase
VVKLYERAAVLGGKLAVAGSLVDGKQVFVRLGKFLEGEARQAGVEILCNREITNAAQLDHPDMVILAAGAVERKLAIAGVRKCVSAEEATNHLDELGQRVVIVGGGMVGAEVAEALAVRGKDVSIVEMLDDVLIGFEFPNKRAVIQKLCDLGVWFYVSSTIIGADDKVLTVKFKDHTRELPYDAVINATGYLPQLALRDELQRSGIEVVAIGDCMLPGRIFNAIHTAVEAVGPLD